MRKKSVYIFNSVFTALFVFFSMSVKVDALKRYVLSVRPVTSYGAVTSGSDKRLRIYVNYMEGNLIKDFILLGEYDKNMVSIGDIKEIHDACITDNFNVNMYFKKKSKRRISHDYNCPGNKKRERLNSCPEVFSGIYGREEFLKVKYLFEKYNKIWNCKTVHITEEDIPVRYVVPHHNAYARKMPFCQLNMRVMTNSIIKELEKIFDLSVSSSFLL